MSGSSLAPWSTENWWCFVSFGCNPGGRVRRNDLASGFAVGLLIALLTFIAGVLMWWRSEVLHIRQLNDDEIVFTGAGEEFLNMLPLRNYFGSTADQCR